MIVEPFAGSAAYATRYADAKVLLIDKDPVIAAVWRYLTKVKESEVRSLPVFKGDESSIDSLGPLPEEARHLIGFWLYTGSSFPRDKRSSWAKTPEYADRFWGSHIRGRIASQVEAIRHWQVFEGSYEDAPNVVADWFVDPPYEKAGRPYRCSSKDIDYRRLADWTKSRRGQVIVCENVGATWLPFERFYDGGTANSNSGVSEEAVFIMDDNKPVEVEDPATVARDFTRAINAFRESAVEEARAALAYENAKRDWEKTQAALREAENFLRRLNGLGPRRGRLPDIGDVP